jgi:ribosomal protein L34
LLRAHFRDQSELHGFLARLRTYGLEVVEVRRLTIDPADKPDTDAP